MQKNTQKDQKDSFGRNEIFDKYKKYFIVMFIMIAIFFTCFILSSFNILPLWVVDIVLIPIVLATVALWYKTAKKHL